MFSFAFLHTVPYPLRFRFSPFHTRVAGENSHGQSSAVKPRRDKKHNKNNLYIFVNTKGSSRDICSSVFQHRDLEPFRSRSKSTFCRSCRSSIAELDTIFEMKVKVWRDTANVLIERRKLTKTIWDMRVWRKYIWYWQSLAKTTPLKPISTTLGTLPRDRYVLEKSIDAKMWIILFEIST
jgi:hypothetical protein